jgi:amino acid adenylation domain-containing protein
MSVTPQSRRRDDILSTLKNVFGRISGIDPSELNVDISLLELGLDSLALIQASQSIQDTLGVKVPFRMLIEENPNIGTLAAYADDQLPTEETHVEEPSASPPAVELESPSSVATPILPSQHSLLQSPIHGPQNSNGSGSLKEQPERLMSNTPLGSIITQQLALMSEQLELLREIYGDGQMQTTPETSIAAVLQPPPASEAISDNGRQLSPSSSSSRPVQPAALPAAETSALSRGEQRKPESYVPYQPFRVSSSGGLSARQQEHLEALIARVCARTQESKRQARLRRPVLADGRASAGFRLLWKEMLYPLVVERASGSHVWDVDGNEYLDIAMGFGALLFGHNPPFIDALQEHLTRGLQIGLVSSLSGKVSELVCELTGMERAAFCNSGTEAVMIALRLARTVTGREKIALFGGSYHGFFDEVLVRAGKAADGSLRMAPVAPGIPMSAADNVLVLEYGEPESLEILKAHASELAAVLVEPVQSRRPDLQPVSFLRELREITSQSGTALIFDEVITGFRVHPGGVQALFDIQADLATYGKGAGGGMPVGIVTGKAAYMNAIDGGLWDYGDASYPRAERTYVAGTYFMHPLTMSVLWATLSHLKNSGPQLQQQLNERTRRFAETINTFFEQERVPCQVVHFGSLFRFAFSDEIKYADLFFYHMLEDGVYTWEGRNCFLSVAHTDEDIEQLIRIIKQAVAKMREGEFLPAFSDTSLNGPVLSSPPPRGEEPSPSQTKEPSSGMTESAVPRSVEPVPAAPGAEVGRVRTVPTTIAQKELWILTQLGDDASRAYNESMTLHLRGSFNFAAMRRAIEKLVARHDALRTTFNADGEYQQVYPELSLDVPFVDYSSLDNRTRQAETAKCLAGEAQEPFDMEHGPLLRVKVVRLEEHYHLLVLTLHHIITDGWSNGVLLHDIAALYSAECLGDEFPLPRPLQFSDYAQQQVQQQQSPQMLAAESYWIRQFADTPPALELPTSRPRPPIQTYAGARQRTLIEASLLKGLKTMSTQKGSTLFLTLLSAFKVLLHRLSGQADLVVGTSAAGQPAVGDQNLVGYCVNLLPLRSRLNGNPTFTEYLAAEKRVLLDAYEHQLYPFAKLIRQINIARDPSRPPLVSVVFNMDAKLVDKQRIPQLEVEVTSNLPEASKYDLTLNITQTDSELRLDWEYNTDLFEAHTIERWQEHFRTLLENIISQPEQRVLNIPLLTDRERHKLLVEWNDTRTDFTLPSAIHHLFEKQAALTPDAIAVVYTHQHLSYHQLNRRANQLARFLRQRGVGPETLVAICLPRSIEMVVALLGVLKAGGAYVPLDPSYPASRLSLMIADSTAALVLTQRQWAESLESAEAEVLYLDEQWGEIADLSGEEIEVEVSPDNLAYVIYTSGSTGTPKGVMNSHGALANRLLWMQAAYPLAADDIILQKTPFSFDVSVWEFLWPLMTGARLVMAEPERHRESQYLADVIAEQQVTVMHFVPSMLQLFVGEAQASRCRTLRRVICSGEALPVELQERYLRDVGSKLENLYGPTEAAIDVTYWSCRGGERAAIVPIGRPIANTQIYVLDGEMEPVGEAIAGELYIGGVGVARGYWRRPELTAEKFVPDRWSEEEGARLFKTGDEARYREDGVLEFIGRLDGQVKVRGNRIELGEIEGVLRKLEGVQDVVVEARDGEGMEKRLVAYVVPGQQVMPNVNELRRFLEQHLPDYMVPSAFVELEALPLTPSGKVDRKALPAPGPARPALQVAYMPPRTPTEEVLTAVWSHVLGLDQVGIYDNFFALGGDSIRGIQVLGRAKERGLDFSLLDLFRHPTISELAGSITQNGATAQPFEQAEPFSLIKASDRAKLPDDVENAYPLTMLQTGMFYHMRLTPDAPVYHNVNSLHLQSPFDAELLQLAVQKVIERHPALRTAFDFDNYSEPLQLVSKSASLPLQIEDLRHLPTDEQEKTIDAYVEQEKQHRFNPANPPLIRIKVHRRRDDSFQWTLTDFHPIIDGWGVAVMFNEICNHYVALLNKTSLQQEPPPSVTFMDYVQLERETLKDVEAHRYWTETLSDSTPMQLPRWPTPAQGSAGPQIHQIHVPISGEVFAGLQRMMRSEAVPLQYVLLTAHMKVMSLLSGQADVMTGLVVDCRLENSGGEQVLGLYLNTVPFRMELEPGTWTELVRSVFKAVLSLLPFRRYPVAALQRDWGAVPLFETFFDFVHFHNLQAISLTGPVKLLEATHNFNDTHYPMQTMFALDRAIDPSQDGSLILRLEYDANEMCREQVEAMGYYFSDTLTRIALDPLGRHEKASLLPAEERHKLLVEWNDTATDYSIDSCIHHLFEKQAALTPDAIAVVYTHQHLSYHQLNRRANQLARFLRQRGVGPETLVAICLPRSIEMVVALLGVLKAGGAYVPLDPSYPASRLSLMIADSTAPLVLTQRQWAESLESAEAEVLYLDEQWAEIAGLSGEEIEVEVSPDNLAYVIYTSGSTGTPKGVMVSHSSVVNLLATMRREPGIEQEDVLLSVTTLSFDIAMLELFLPLITGARLVLADREDVSDGAKLREHLLADAITMMQATPATWKLLVESGWQGETPLRVLCGGEALSHDLAMHLTECSSDVWNMYGPTETTIWSTTSRVERGQPLVSIGRPVGNTQVYILDPDGQPSPLGASGELFIGGAGVARGYLHRPELTCERFVPHPFTEGGGERLYRTGDLARYLPDGSLQYLGRIDQQVKVRGFRIEPGEVEAALVQHPAVRECVVIAREDADSDKRLVAYLVKEATADAGEVSISELRSYLKQRLPDYMVPAQWVVLDALPLTLNGKINRRALPKPDSSQTGLTENFVAPTTPLEKELAEISAQILGLERVGIYDSFFDLGGHSLMGMQFMMRVCDTFHVDLPLRTLFETPTVAGLAQRIEMIRLMSQELQTLSIATQGSREEDAL